MARAKKSSAKRKPGRPKKVVEAPKEETVEVAEEVNEPVEEAPKEAPKKNKSDGLPYYYDENGARHRK